MATSPPFPATAMLAYSAEMKNHVFKTDTCVQHTEGQGRDSTVQSESGKVLWEGTAGRK